MPSRVMPAETERTMRAAEQVIARCREIAACTEVPGETTRTFLGEPMRAVHALVRRWMEAAGMAVHVDAAGNLRGRLRGRTAAISELPVRVAIGSHLDTVPNAGAFDGVLGVVLGLAVAEEIGPEELPFDLEVIGFSEEEGVRFGRPFLGSMAAAGTLSEEMLRLTDRNGVSVVEAIRGFGLEPEEIASARMGPEVFAYLEAHIEQGPVLDAAGLPVGVVRAIAGQTRLRLTFTGRANHAGTTPMGLRQDAMAAAAEWIGLVEQRANETAGLVATVGRVETLPGAGNVIAGVVLATLDVRHAQDAVRRSAVSAMLDAARAAGARRGVRVESDVLLEQAAVEMDARLVERLAEAAGEEAPLMISGAGHDAMVMAPVVPSVMLFVRSPGGISHHPQETVRVQDVAVAIGVAIKFLRAFISS